MRKQRKERGRQSDISGLLSLEACISVLIFMMMMLILAGLFRMFMAQNATAHAVLETAQSLSLDAYAGEKIGNGGWGSESVGDLINGLFGLYYDNDFSSYDNWFGEAADRDADVGEVVKRRFTAYISGGDENEADELLERLNVVNGLGGIDFTGSRVENGTLYVNVKYKLKYDFQIGGLGQVDVEQEACAKLWQ